MSDQVTTPIQPGEIANFLLDELNPTVITDFVTTLNPSMIIDNPLAVYTKLVGKTHQPNKFANQLDFKAIVLLKIDNTSIAETPYANFMKKFISLRLLGDGYNSPAPSFICMVPELNAVLVNPFRLLSNPSAFLQRALRYPYFTLDSADPTFVDKMTKAEIGSLVDVRFDNTNYNTGRVTKFVAGGNISEIVHNGFTFDALSAFNSGAALNQDGTKIAKVAARTGLSEPAVIALVANLVPGGVLTSDFGPRNTQIGSQGVPISSDHGGIDIGAPIGTPIYAPKDGVVTGTRDSGKGGLLLEIQHGSAMDNQSTKSQYLHLSEFVLKEGDTVKAGDVIALVGKTGNSTGPHLHLQVRTPPNNKVTDPWYWLSNTTPSLKNQASETPQGDPDGISGLIDPATGVIAPPTFSF
tara:strand:+ start:149 stop:1378 length:1230 start_codon:yes stop_codon:yes gene_type:complete